MEEFREEAWIEIVERCQEAIGVDAFECNFSLSARPARTARMGLWPWGRTRRDPRRSSSRWVMSRGQGVPVWAKMTPNVTHIEDPTRAALSAGCHGISAINTIRSVIGVNLDTLRPEPSVEGFTTPGGYSCKAVMPIALQDVHGDRQADPGRMPGPIAIGHRGHRIGTRRSPVPPLGLRHGAGLHLRHEGGLSLHQDDVRRIGGVHGAAQVWHAGRLQGAHAPLFHDPL